MDKLLILTNKNYNLVSWKMEEIDGLTFKTFLRAFVHFFTQIWITCPLAPSKTFLILTRRIKIIVYLISIIIWITFFYHQKMRPFIGKITSTFCHFLLHIFHPESRAQWVRNQINDIRDGKIANPQYFMNQVPLQFYKIFNAYMV